MIEMASVAIEQLTEETRRSNDRRYATERLLAESDRLHDALERLNLAERTRTPRELRPRLLAFYAKVLGETLSDQHHAVSRTQAAQEHMYDVQEKILARRRADRGLVLTADDESVALTAWQRAYRLSVTTQLRDAPDGLRWADLAPTGLPTEERAARQGVLEDMEGEGLVGCASTSSDGRRYFWVGEGERGE